MRTRLGLRPFVASLLLSVSALSQSIEWTARFDDTRAGYDQSRSALSSATGELSVLGSRDAGTVLFTVAPDGQILSEIPHTDADQVFSRTLTATSDGAVLLAALRRDAGLRRTILVLLRRPSGATAWSESLFTSPAEWSGAEALSVDAAGNVIISGGTYCTGEPTRLTVVSFDPQGVVR